MNLIPNRIQALPAVPVPQRPTSASNAWWRGEYLTKRLTSPIEAVRVHLSAGSAATIHRHLASGAGPQGRWFAVGDIIMIYDRYRASRALPGHFTHIAIATLAAGTILNVGYCAPLFGQPGGGDQLEFVEGPAPVLRSLDAVWSRSAGHA